MNDDIEREDSKSRFTADVGLTTTLVGLGLFLAWPDGDARPDLFIWSTLAIGLILFTAGHAACAIRYAVRELDPNFRTPAQARREAIDAREAQQASQPVHDDSHETADVQGG